MNLMRAFTVMLSGVTAVDAPRRQVNGILEWRDYVMEALRHANSHESPSGTDVSAALSSETHAGWRAAAGEILAALLEQEADADRRYHRAKQQMAAAEAAARREETAAATCRALAAASTDDKTTAALQAEAQQHDAEAARHREDAEAARRRMEAAMAWIIAARDAIGYGQLLVTQEDGVALPVGEAIARAGGYREVYGEKHALTADGSRPLAIRGGAR